jgi:Secretion system C-terminal sorting domain
VQKTTDGGSNWFLVTTGLNTTAGYNGLSVIDANTLFVSNTASQVFGTTDGGANWTNLNFPLTGIGTLFCTDWLNANTGMVGGVFGTIGKTTNRGASWEISYTGGYTTMGIDMVHPDTAFAVCGNIAGGQIFKYVSGALTGTINWNSEIPREYSLSQNYPNPFNPSTTIKFSLPKAGVVSLKVFEVSGREVKTLINGLSLNTGVVTYDFDGSELSSGIYFYSLFVDNNRIDTKKMILVK